MHTDITNPPAPGFLSGGGEMGELIRTMDWSKSSVGDPSQWPQSLRTSVSICLHSRFPMVIWWSKDLVQIYNDGYREILAAKHEGAMGSTAQKVWPEIWHIIGPMLNGVLDSGEPTWSEDQHLIIDRHGYPEESYFTFSYSAIHDESGKTGGVFCAVNETTKKVLTEKHLVKQLNNLFIQAPVALCILRGENYEVEVINEKMLEIWGTKLEDALHKPVFDVLPDVKDQGFKALLDNVYHKGERFITDEHPISLLRNGKIENAFLKFVYEPLREEDETISGVMAVAHEITEQVNSRKKIEESEAFNRTVLESSPDCLKVIDGEGRLIFMNSNGLCTMEIDDFGAVQNKPWWELWGKNNQATVKAAVLKALGGEPAYFQGMDFTAKGTPKWWDVIVSPVMEDSGKKVSNIIAVSRDITQQKKEALKLKESEAYFRQMTDLMPAKITNADLAGAVTYYNKSWLNYTGKNFDELKDFGYHNIIHPDEMEEFERRLEHGAATGTDVEMEMRFKNAEGEYKWHLNLATPVKDETGKIAMWIGVTTEIQKMKEEERLKNNFLSMASHELKTPVTTIKAYGQIAEMMLREKGDTATLDIVNRMTKQINKLNNLIVDLLDFTKIKKGRLVYHEDWFDFSAFVQEIIEDMQHTSATHTIESTIGDSARIYGDKDKLGQVLNNLISNAIKYSPKANKIIVSTTLLDKGMKLSVTDYGIGIAEDAQEKVFEEFYRVTGDNQSTYPGMGIGLYIGSEIIRKFRGRLWVERTGDAGSIFSFSIPLDHREGVSN